MRGLHAVVVAWPGRFFLPVTLRGDRKLPNVMKDELSLPDPHQQIQQALDSHPITQRMSIRVEIYDSVIVLRGVVRTYYAKQMAQEVSRLAMREFVPPPTLRNMIEVLYKGG